MADDIKKIMRDIAKGRKNELGDYWADSWCDQAADRIEELEKENTRLDNELVGECETTSVLTTELAVAENDNKELKEQIKAFEDWLINWYDSGFSEKKTRAQIQQELKRRMLGART